MQKTRADLKSFFVENAIPTADDFASLIDSGLNQTDDGITLTAGALSVSRGLAASVAAGSTSTTRGLDITFGARNNASTAANHPLGRALYVSGVSDAAGAEFRNADGTAGISIGSAKIQAIGANTNQELQLAGKGSSPVNVTSGLSITGGSVTVVSGGASITGGPVTIGTAGNNRSLTVNGSTTVTGTATVGALSFPAPPGDLSPVITARTVPVDQGNATESTELILFHGNDPANGFGPDYITLRAPAIRLQTYSNANVLDIANSLGSNTRLLIEPTGGITASGLVTAAAGLTVTGAAVTLGTAVTAQNGLTVSAGGLTVTGLLTANTGVTIAGALTASGAVTAQSGLTVTGLLATNGDVSVTGTVTASSAVTAQNGLTVSLGGLTVAAGGLNVTGLLTANTGVSVTGTLTASGAVTAQSGLTVSAGGLAVTGLLAANSGVSVTGTVTASAAITAQNGLTVSAGGLIVSAGGLIVSAGGLTVTGALNAKSGLAVTGGLSTTGTLVAGGLFTAQNGVNVTAGGLTVTGVLTANTGASITGTVTATGLVTAQSGLTVTGVLTANTGVSVTGTVTATGLVTAQNGLTVSNGGLTLAGSTNNLTVGGTLIGPPNDYMKAQLTLSGGGAVTWAGNKLKWTARFIAISTGNPASFPGGNISIAMPAVGQTVSVYDGTSRAIDASGLSLTYWEALYAAHTIGGSASDITFKIVVYNVAHTVPSNWILIAVRNLDDGALKLGTGDILTPNSTLLRSRVTVTDAGVTTVAGDMTVSGTTQVNTIVFPPPPGDPSPVITARTVPVGQGNAAESTELILFHSNDPNNGAGPDYITLRAPAIRLQTYSNTNVSDINNNLGSNDRLRVEPDGTVNVAGLLKYGSISAGSSRTLKEDICDLSVDEALSVFRDLNPVKYRLKAEPSGRTHVGFIAEDVPSLVSSEDHSSIAPNDILAVVTQIVHIQQRSIERLERQIAALTAAPAGAASDGP